MRSSCKARHAYLHPHPPGSSSALIGACRVTSHINWRVCSECGVEARSGHNRWQMRAELEAPDGH